MQRLKLFGGVSIETESGPLTGRAVQRRRLALLAMLAVARARGVSRERVITFLWPDADAENGRSFLSDSVYRINQALGGDVILTPGDELRLDATRLPSDLDEFEEALARGDHEEAIRTYAGPFLDGFFLPEAVEFERWSEGERERLGREYARALEAVAVSAEQTGRQAVAVDWWRKLAAQDPYNSRVALRLMQSLVAAGERAAAIQHARVHETLLRQELDIEPDAAVRALAEQLRRAPVAAPPATSGPAKSQAPSVAVLPFLNLGADPESDYFADGITDDVIAHLSKIRALSVISRTSVMPFKTRQRSLREIGAALGVTTVLDGSVRYSRDRVRVVAKLVDVRSDRHLWAETYDRQLTDIFTIQTDVALQIALALQAELSRDERARVGKGPTADIRAYQSYQRGREWYIKYTPESLERAIEFFDRAIARDPGFALAHANKAMAYAALGEAGAMAPEIAYGRAMDAAATALRLDPELAAAHCTIAFLKGVSEFDWAGAEAGFKRAIELSPSAADAYDLYGRLCSALARYDDAIALQRRAHELDPLAHRMDRVTTLLRAGRFDEAVVNAEEAVEFDPTYDRARATLGWAYFLSGRRAEGLEHLKEAVSLTATSTMWLGQLGQAYAMAGNAERAREILRELERYTKTSYVSPYHFAYVYTGLGEHDKAMDFLERAVAERTGPAYSIKGSFLLIALHQHPRFQALLRKMGLQRDPEQLKHDTVRAGATPGIATPVTTPSVTTMPAAPAPSTPHAAPAATPPPTDGAPTTSQVAHMPRRRIPRVVLAAAAVLALVGLGVVATVIARGRGAVASRTEPATMRTIAVLPFVNLSADRENEYFSDGITEELITTLGQVPGLRVASRTSAFTYKNKSVDVREVGRQLGAAAVVEGRVRRSGNTLRVTAQLVDAATGYNLWSATYDREAADVFAIQEEISRAIAARLVGTLGAGKRVTLAERSTRDPVTYDLYLRGRHAWHERTRQSMARAIEHFSQAVAREPDYARAHVGLGDAYAVSAFYDYLPPRDAYPKAEAAARRAIELDPALAAPHATLGYILTYYHMDWSRSEDAFKRALAADPDYATAHQWYGNLLTVTARFDEAEREFRAAQEADPLSLIAQAALGWSYYYAGKYDAALEQCRRTLVVNPSFELAHMWGAWALIELGRAAEAREWSERAVKLSKRSPLTSLTLAYVLGRFGSEADKAAARAVVREMELRRARGEYLPAYEIAKVHLALADRAAALTWLKRAVDDGSHSRAFFRVDPQLAVLRGDTQFDSLVRGHRQ